MNAPLIVEIIGWISQLPPNQQLSAWLRVNQVISLMAVDEQLTIPQLIDWTNLEDFIFGAIMALRIQHPVKGD